MKVTRCYFDSNHTVAYSQLHGFSDASDQAFAAVVYLHSSYSDDSVEVRIVATTSLIMLYSLLQRLLLYCFKFSLWVVIGWNIKPAFRFSIVASTGVYSI